MEHSGQKLGIGSGKGKGVWIVVRRKESDERKKERLKGLRRCSGELKKEIDVEVGTEREVKVKRGFRKRRV